MKDKGTKIEQANKENPVFIAQDSAEKTDIKTETSLNTNIFLGSLILLLMAMIIISTITSGLFFHTMNQTLNDLSTQIIIKNRPTPLSIAKFANFQAIPTKVPTFTSTSTKTITPIPTPQPTITPSATSNITIQPTVTDTPIPTSTVQPLPPTTLAVTTSPIYQLTPTKPAQLFNYSSAGDWNQLYSARIHFSETPGGRAIVARVKAYKSATFDNYGAYIAVVSGTDLYLLASDNSVGGKWLVETDSYTIAKDGVWSPDGLWFAFVVKFRDCLGCFNVAILPRPAEMTQLPITADQVRLAYPPMGYTVTDAPRWTVEGDLLVNAHQGEPSNGEAFIYTPEGQQLRPSCDQTYQLAASSYGQQYYEWLPGKAWRFCQSDRADTYFSD